MLISVTVACNASFPQSIEKLLSSVQDLSRVPGLQRFCYRLFCRDEKKIMILTKDGKKVVWTSLLSSIQMELIVPTKQTRFMKCWTGVCRGAILKELKQHIVQILIHSVKSIYNTKCNLNHSL